MKRSGSVKHRDRRDGTCLAGLPADGLKRVLAAGCDEFRMPGRTTRGRARSRTSLSATSSLTTATGVLIWTYRPPTADRRLHAAARNRLAARVALTMLAPGRWG